MSVWGVSGGGGGGGGSVSVCVRGGGGGIISPLEREVKKFTVSCCDCQTPQK